MANEFLNFILAIVVIVTAAKLSGYASMRLGQPAVLGELIVGLLLGPTLLDLLHVWPPFDMDDHLGESLELMAELGVILLMMLAGLQLHLDELLRSGKVAAFAGVLGVAAPLILGWGTGRLFGLGNAQSVFVGLALSATSVSISAQTLMEMKVLRSRVGLGLLGAAVFDDILVILLLSLSFILLGSGGGGAAVIVWTVLRMVGYLVAALLAGHYLLPRLLEHASRLPVSQGTLAFVVCACLFYAWGAEVIGGMASITGAFIVGLFLARTPLHNQIEEGVSALAYGFFVPIFLVNIGLEVDLRVVAETAVWFTLALTGVAIVSKIVGSGLGARLAGFSLRESVQLGIGMTSRGEVGLIVATFALTEQMISRDIFSILVFMVIVATLVTPPLLRLSFRQQTPPQPKAA